LKFKNTTATHAENWLSARVESNSNSNAQDDKDDTETHAAASFGSYEEADNCGRLQRVLLKPLIMTLPLYNWCNSPTHITRCLHYTLFNLYTVSTR
jgi:hypothetical protein